MKVTKVGSCEKSYLSFNNLGPGEVFRRVVDGEFTGYIYVKIDKDSYIWTTPKDSLYHIGNTDVDLGEVLRIEICEITYKDKD